MLNQLGYQCQPQPVQRAEQFFRGLVQLVGDLKEPRAAFSSGKVPRVPQVQSSGPGVDVHNDNLVRTKVDAQARVAG